MTSRTRALSEVLDHLDQESHRQTVTIDDCVRELGPHSFSSMMLVFALISTSPASAIPGLTAAVAVIEFTLAAQMMFGCHSVWLPRFIASRELAVPKLRKGISWLRRPVLFVERFLRPRLTFLLVRPWLFLPLLLVMTLTIFMPFMEAIPTSGSIASAIIALFAAGWLACDGLLVLLAIPLLAALPVAVLYLTFF
jgi:hypothetical protein